MMSFFSSLATDLNKDGKLSFSDFCNAITPLAKEYA